MQQGRAGRAAFLAVAIAALPLGSALAQSEPVQPGAGSPFSVEDAAPQDRGVLQLEGLFGYERSRRGAETFRLRPELEYGLTDRLELRLSGAYAVGDGDSVQRGSVAPGFRLQLVEQAGLVPNFSILGEVAFPFGAGDESTFTELVAITSWTTGRGPGAWGLHLNAAWLARPDPGQEERRNGYRFGAATSHAIDRDTFVLVGYSQETQERGERDLSLVEAGVERRFGNMSFGVAAGAGLNEDSPRFRVVAGLKVKFETGRR